MMLIIAKDLAHGFSAMLPFLLEKQRLEVTESVVEAIFESRSSPIIKQLLQMGMISCNVSPFTLFRSRNFSV